MKHQRHKDLKNRHSRKSILVPFIKGFLWITTLIMFSWSCYYDNEEFLYPKLSSSCDTIDVTFSSVVKPVLQQYCYTCHSNSIAASFGGNIKLEDYADVKISADNGKLYGTVAHLPGYSPMPKGGSKLDGCDISMIKSWIDSGAPDN